MTTETLIHRHRVIVGASLYGCPGGPPVLAIATHGHDNVVIVGRSDGLDDAWTPSRGDFQCNLWRVHDRENVGKILHVKDDLLLRTVNGGVDGADIVADIFGGCL